MDLERITEHPCPKEHFSFGWQHSHTNILRQLNLRSLDSRAALPANQMPLISYAALGRCYGLCVCVPSPTSHVDTLTPSVLHLETGFSRRG